MWLVKKKIERWGEVFKKGESGDAIAHAPNYKLCSSNLSLANHKPHKNNWNFENLWNVSFRIFHAQKTFLFGGGGGNGAMYNSYFIFA